MKPAFATVADLSNASKVAMSYTARLAEVVNGRLVLEHVYMDPLLAPEASLVAAPVLGISRQEMRTELLQRAKYLPVPVEVEISLEPLQMAVTSTVKRHHPVLLAIGREQPQDLFDRLFANMPLPVLRDAGYPLLVVPETWGEAELPNRVVVAADDQSFRLTAPSLALAELFTALHPSIAVVHVAVGETPSQAQVGLESVDQAGLFGHITTDNLFEVCDETPAKGILQATAERQAQLIVVLARPHTFWEGLFHQSVTAQLMRTSPVPILVLPTMP